MDRFINLFLLIINQIYFLSLTSRVPVLCGPHCLGAVDPQGNKVQPVPGVRKEREVTRDRKESQARGLVEGRTFLGNSKY